jgi:transposase
MGTDAKHVVRLTVAERVQLEGIVADSRAAKSRVLRSRMLLKADADGPAWPDSQIAEAFEVNALTVARLRKRCVWEGLDAALAERPRSAYKPRKLDGAGEAQLIAIACGAAPEGRAKWTMQLLADKLVELEIVDEISDEAVRLTLKKTSLNRGCASSGSSRPTTMPSSCAAWKTY